jgi:xanthosine utilization system XapX-like protein
MGRAAQWTPQILLILGLGLLIANVRIGLDAVNFLRRRSSALLTWSGPRPRYYGLQLALGVLLGLLLLYDIVVLRRPAPQLFGIGMMFLYYGYLVPLSRRIGRGFYADGIWSESGFVPYWKIGAVSWREGEEIALVIVSRLRNLARRLVVPGAHYAAARRLLRDKIAAHDIQLMHTGLELGAHDERDDV